MLTYGRNNAVLCPDWYVHWNGGSTVNRMTAVLSLIR